MELGTKGYYMNVFKSVLMTNLITSESKSMSATYSYYENLIDEDQNSPNNTKAVLLRNLQKAYDEIVHELIGHKDV